MEKYVKDQKTRYEFFNLPKGIAADEEIKKTIHYKALKLALSENKEKSKTEIKTKFPFWFFTPLDNDTPAQPIASINPSGNTLVLTGTLPIHAEGETTHIGVDYLSANGENDLAFNLLRNDTIVSTMSQKHLFQSFPTLIPLRLSLSNKTTIKVMVYNNSTVATHRIKMVITGYYWYVGNAVGLGI